MKPLRLNSVAIKQVPAPLQAASSGSLRGCCWHGTGAPWGTVAPGGPGKVQTLPARIRLGLAWLGRLLAQAVLPAARPGLTGAQPCAEMLPETPEPGHAAAGQSLSCSPCTALFLAISF